MLQHSIRPVNYTIKTKANLVLNNDGLEFRTDYNVKKQLFKGSGRSDKMNHTLWLGNQASWLIQDFLDGGGSYWRTVPPVGQQSDLAILCSCLPYRGRDSSCLLQDGWDEEMRETYSRDWTMARMPMMISVEKCQKSWVEGRCNGCLSVSIPAAGCRLTYLTGESSSIDRR